MTALAPVIDSVTAAPASLTAGGSAIVTVKAHDPNARTVSLSIAATVDGVTSAPATVTIQVGAGPITFGAPTVSDPLNVATVTANADGTFTLKV